MEKEGKLSSFDEYSESSKGQNNRTGQLKQQSSLYDLDSFPITTSPWIASVSFLFQLHFIIHSIDFYTDNACPIFANTNCFNLVSQFIGPNMEIIAFILNILLSVFSVLSLIFNKGEEEGYKYILGWIGSKLFPFLRYMIDINLAIAAIFLVQSPYVTICFVLAAIVNIGVHFFGQNYTLRKDYLCCKSLQYMLMWKLSLIIGYVLNCASYYFGKGNKTVFIIFLVLLFLTFLSLLISYFIFGYVMYRHMSSQIVFLASINLFCAISLGNLFDFFMALLHNQFIPNRNIVFSACFFLILIFVNYCVWTKIKKCGSNMQNKKSRKKNFFLFYKLENSSQNISDDCEVRGIIRYHLSRSCTNSSCFTNQQEQFYFDAKKNKYCYPNKINQGKTSFIKLLAKCAYQEQLEINDEADSQLLLQYIEFYYMKLKNLFKVTLLLIELEKRFLSPFQKLRLTRLRKVMREQNIKINEQLYNGSLDLQNLISSQNKFDQIQLQLKEVLTKNLQFWKYLQNDSINLSTIVKMLNPNFKLIDRINNNWKCIAKYFDIQRIWKFMFVCYTLYIRNQKIKPQFLQQFGQSVHEDELFNIESQHIDKTTEANKLYVPKMIFEQDVCCIHVNYSQQKPIIKNVSRYFERMFGYNSNQIIESSLQIMMTPCFRQFHKKKFLKWAGSGKPNKESNYQVKKIFPVNKEGFVLSTFKFYKQFLCLNEQLQYVAMLKKNKEQENVIILNDNYEIQGMSQSVMQKLHFSYKQYKQMIGLNLLIFAPGLIQFTKFQQVKEDLSQDILSYLSENATKYNVTHELSQKTKFTRKLQINTKKQFTKNNVHLYIPQTLESIRYHYVNESMSKQKIKIFSAIGRCNKQLMEQQSVKKFKVQIEVRQIKLQGQNTYFQFYLREIETAERNDSKISVNKIYVQRQNQSFEDNINEQDINRFFQNSQNSQSISLAFNDNMFIKEDNNEAVQMISHVSSISLYVRIIFIIFFGLLIGGMLFQYNNYQSYKQNSMEMHAMVGLQLGSLMLDNKYHSQLLNISGIRQTVKTLTDNLRTIRQKNFHFKNAVLSKQINQNKNFTLMGLHNESQQYDQIDIIDKMFENIIQILYDNKGDVTLDLPTYNSFHAIILPSIQELTTSCMNNIGNQFDVIYRKIQVKNNVYIAIGVVLLTLGFLLVFSSLLKITKSFVSLMEIFTQFSEVDIKKITKYCMFLNLLFIHLAKKYDQFKQNDKSSNKSKDMKSMQLYQPQNSTQSGFKLANTVQASDGIGASQDEKQEQDKANLNKKVKKVEKGKQLTNLKLKSIACVIVFLVLYGASAFGFNLYTSIVNKSIANYKDMGVSIFKYYSALNIYVLSMKDKAIYGSTYEPSKYQIYHQRIAKMKILKQQTPNGLGSKFLQLRNNVLFGNICEVYPQVLNTVGYSQQECKMISENNLQHGVQSYLFYMISNVDFFLSSSSLTINPTIATQTDAGLEICNAYLQFLLNQWASMFTDLMATLNRNILAICSSLFVFQIIIYVVLIEFFIVGNLKEKFMFFKKIYNNLLPDYIVTKEKIIKAKLQVEGIIKK